MSAPAALPEFMTTREVASLLRVKERKVYDMAAADEIPCRRVTGKLLFPRSEIEAWLAGDTTTAAVVQGIAPNVVAGSHDPLLEWAIRESGSELATFFDGSLDGLARIRAGEALAAGMHVFEPHGGNWNIQHAAEALTDRNVVLVEWAKRQQGLIVAPAVANEIGAVSDLRGRRVAQRQAAAGAGLLLQHLLTEAGINLDEVRLLTSVARTETEAAVAVASGRADAAPGLMAMARQFGLGFAPTVMERFDLLIDRRSWFEPPLQKLFAFCCGKAFAAKAVELGGYDLAKHGRVHWNGA